MEGCMNTHVGFIGLGNMGNSMASHLIEAGYSLTVYDINQKVLKTFESIGANIAATPAEVASAAKTVILSLPNPTIVGEVVLGNSGVIEGTAVNTVIDMSTTGAKMAREIASALSEKPITLVDAPVSGGVPGAKVKKLAIMVSCPDDRFEEIKLLLSNIGKVFFIGNKPGMDQDFTAIVQMLERRSGIVLKKIEQKK
jgi:3-hydroxyisobutyrate dehydrogenase-like beta-hydroxyacid dehydrogenase